MTDKLTLEDERIKNLLRQAARGDKDSLARIEKEAPEVLDLLTKEWFPLAREVEDQLIKAIFSQDLLARKSVKHQAEELRQTLCAIHKTPLEKLMIDRVVCTWIAVSHADLVAATLLPRDKAAQKWVDRCQKRFSAACKDLAAVHKLLAPNVQLNVAKRQQVLNLFPQQTG